MAITQNTYTGDGTTVLFTISFPYLEQDHVKASVNGTPTTAFTFANSNTIQFTVAPANGAAILLFRETESGELQNQFFPNSSIPSSSLNNNFTQGLYIAQETDNTSTQALSNSQTAITTANGAVVTANAADVKADAAIVTADAADIAAAAAVITANAADVNASAAVVTANTAESNSLSAISTANSAAAAAAAAVSTANGAVSTANSATSTANTALGNSATAISTADSAVVIANSAVDTADGAVVTADAAVVTADQAAIDAQTAIDTADAAVVTADAADSKADQAIAAVANALLFDIVANVAAIPGSPDDQDAVEVTNGTGIESFTPLSGLPSGFVGDSGLSVRLIYDDANSTWIWLQYFPNDPENRYGDAITTLQGDVSTLQGDVSTAQGDITTLQSDVLGLDSDKLAVTTAASTYALIDAATLTGLTLAERIGIKTEIVFSDADESHGVILKAPATVPANVTFSLPSADGTSGQYLTTDGSGQLEWETPDPGVLLIDGGNFDNGSSTINISQTFDGGQF